MTDLPANITAVAHQIDAEARRRRFGHQGGVVWLTGLSGSGKSTIGVALEAHLFAAGMNAVLLDGDNLRHGLTSDLGFSPDDRRENLRRVGEVAALFAKSGAIVITALISPYSEDRARARKAANGQFIEVYVAADLDTCKARDPKGPYAKAISGEISEFTGVSAPYEVPTAPDLRIDTTITDLDACVAAIATEAKVRFIGDMSA